jgi:adenylate cyclase
MAEHVEYTTLAHRYTARFPVMTYVAIQANFWIAANILLIIVLYLFNQIFGTAFRVSFPFGFGKLLLVAVFLGVLYGISIGLPGYYLDKAISRRLSLGKMIICKAAIAVAVLIMLLLLLRFVLFDLLMGSSSFLGIQWNDRSWDYLFALLLIYYFFMTLLIGFINQVNKKYGPGILIPLLLGRYRSPKSVIRIFMFMDLKSSTAAAEELGHLKYSSFIRDCFMDINEVLFPFRAQVYQYVGDGIVVMWPESEGLAGHACIRFYFACQKQFQKRAAHYRDHYGFLPVFKAGLHVGKVTAVEIGEIKQDIAYHGDTLNTAARIQSVCHEYRQDLLVSEDLIKKLGTHPDMQLESLGRVMLKGKANAVGITGVDWNL